MLIKIKKNLVYVYKIVVLKFGIDIFICIFFPFETTIRSNYTMGEEKPISVLAQRTEI